MRPARLSARRVTVRALAPALGLTLVIGVAAYAAELQTAELVGTTNDVTVEQGSTTSFTISLWATGSIRCSATPTTPAKAKVDTVYGVDAAGAVTSNTLSAPAAFYADPSCNITWSGDPAPQTVTASVTVDPNAPLGAHAIRLHTSTSTPAGTGSTLADAVPTLVTFEVVKASDTTPPVVKCSGPDGTLSLHGWYVTRAWYDCTATDGQSGLANADDASFSLATSGEGAVSTGARTVTDKAGNSTDAGPYGPYHVDLHDPTVTLTTPPAGAVYVLGTAATADYTCADTPSGSGVESCDGTLPLGVALDTTSIGTKSFTARAVDRAGRSTTVSHTYDVIYDFEARFQTGQGRTTLRAGSSEPVWWSLKGISDPGSFVAATSAVVDCDATDVAPSGEPASIGAVNYDSSSDLFRFVWKTDKAWAGRCRQLQIHLNDGTVRTAVYAIR